MLRNKDKFEIFNEVIEKWGWRNIISKLNITTKKNGQKMMGHKPIQINNS